MANNTHQKNNTLNNTIKSKNKIKLNMYLGVINGNILDPVIPSECSTNSLDFSCSENSQYIPAI